MAKEKEKIFNILDYMDWRGDVLPSQVPFGEVDFVIFSELVYSPLENLKSFKGRKLKDLCGEIYPKALTDKDGFLRKTRYDLWKKVPSSPRFADVLLQDFVSRFEPENSKQFAAALFTYNGEAVVSYRGTDSTIIGWKEDMMLSFEVPVSAQADALSFLDSISPSYEKIYLCGHSKGGNLAKYAGTYCREQDKIVRLYDFDGPGLDDGSLKSEKWEKIKGRISGFIPQSSVVGLLLGRGTVNTVVKSRSMSVMQHNPFYWHVLGPNFVSAEDTTLSSKTIDMTLHEFLDHLSNEKRRFLVETVFGLLEATGARELRELPASVAKNFTEVKKSLSGVSDEDWKSLKEMGELLMQSSGASIKSVYSKKINKEKIWNFRTIRTTGETSVRTSENRK